MLVRFFVFEELFFSSSGNLLKCHLVKETFFFKFWLFVVVVFCCFLFVVGCCFFLVACSGGGRASGLEPNKHVVCEVSKGENATKETEEAVKETMSHPRTQTHSRPIVCWRISYVSVIVGESF